METGKRIRFQKKGITVHSIDWDGWDEPEQRRLAMTKRSKGKTRRMDYGTDTLENIVRSLIFWSVFRSQNAQDKDAVKELEKSRKAFESFLVGNYHP